nr:DUF3079 domain-containing protein [Rubrivivax pictus]
MARRFPIQPAHPERVCWGCDRYCASDAMICGNGSVRTPHPSELFGEDWAEWGLDSPQQAQTDETCGAPSGAPSDAPSSAGPPPAETPCPSPTTVPTRCTTT